MSSMTLLPEISELEVPVVSTTYTYCTWLL